MKKLLSRISVAVVGVLIAMSGVQAEDKALGAVPGKVAPKPADKEKVVPYTGTTLEKIKERGALVIGVRSDSIPLSYTTSFKPNGEAIGYAVDICTKLSSDFKKLNHLNVPDKQVFVTAANRNAKVIAGEVDLECGSTSNTADRRKEVGFGITYYVAGVKAMVGTTSKIHTVDDLRGKKVGYIAKTTSGPVLLRLNKVRGFDMKLRELPNPDAAYTALRNGEIEALLYFDMMLAGINSNSADPSKFKVIGFGRGSNASDAQGILTVEPISFMFRKNDKEFGKFLNTEMVSMIKDGSIKSLYDKWFMQPIAPKNLSMNIPPSRLLKDVWNDPTDIVGN